jgi:hypothetical protein
MSVVSIAEKTRNAVLRSKKRVWTIDDFKTDKVGAVLRELSRLTHQGVLVRASKGIYVRPVLTPLGPSVLSKEELAKVKARRKGLNMVPSGYAGFNALGLTTQVSGVMELAVNRPMQTTQAEKKRVRFLVRDRRTLTNATERAILEALRRINNIADTTPIEVIKVITRNIRGGKTSFERLALLALQSEPPRVRALMGAIGEELRLTSEILDRLRDSLNPTTVFHIPTGKSLHNAGKWRIQN